MKLKRVKAGTYDACGGRFNIDRQPAVWVVFDSQTEELDNDDNLVNVARRFPTLTAAKRYVEARCSEGEGDDER